MVRRPHDYGSRVIGYEIQARRLRKRKRGRGGETPSLALPLSGGATPAPEAQIVVRSPSPNARQAAQQLRVSVGAGGPVQPPLQSPVAITAHRPSVALIPATPAHGTVRATPVQFKGGPTPLPSPTRKGPSMASIPPVDLVSAGGSSVLAADDGGDDSDSNVLGPSPTEAESGGWKRDAWVTIGRFDRKDCAIPPVASLQYMFDVPLPSTTPAWAMAVLPDHRDAVHCEPRDWVGHPAIGTHPGVTGYVPSLDPKVSYMSCQGVLPRCVSQFRVRALNGIGWSEYSEPTTAIRTTRTAPQPPGQVKLKGRADNLLSLYWAPARPNGYPVTRYQLECRLHDPLDVTDIPTSRYKPKPETLWTLIRDDLIDTYCLVPGLRYGCGYVFRVKAENKVGWSLWSDDSEIIKTSRLLT